ncbi:DUF423 domain-containing protein [Hwangdonia lutea]|uniref:DUF423 domain-containing protein n=1 Tax=Hwangdonia lutea TaxID=3075823 RepID=A0AA97HSI8_9FLAO|nr:DUF423 domain-containing protein [Hwangdonia sp. SCSIO 19198]WOD45165.1 DUF423 domain-containing protein [Hwangdonia sp. SCSIO 19198]
MNKKILITATLLGLTSVILGAFAAHGLKALISEASLQTFETGVRYQMYHALLLLFVGSTSLITQNTKRLVFYFVLVGVFFFSGSIYGLATNDLTSFNFKSIALITPIGGLLLILAWGFLFKDFLKIKAKNDN